MTNISHRRINQLLLFFWVLVFPALTVGLGMPMNSDKMFGPGWWFDTGCHALFGIGASVTLVRILGGRIMMYALWRVRGIIGLFILPLFIILAVWFMQVEIWERFEHWWDISIYPLKPEWGMLQKSAFDTKIDNAATIIPAVAIAIYYIVRALRLIYHYPISSKNERLEHLIFFLEGVFKEVPLLRKEDKKYIFRRIVRYAHELRKELREVSKKSRRKRSPP